MLTGIVGEVEGEKSYSEQAHGKVCAGQKP